MMLILDNLQLLINAAILVLPVLFAVLILTLRLKTKPLPDIKRHKREFYFEDPLTDKPGQFPDIKDEPSVELSVIIPAYNEETRLPTMLKECMSFLEHKAVTENLTYEVILVSDGSSDGTATIALKYSRQYTTDKFRLLELVENRGKGGAVRLGMLSARGRFLLFADADGATKFSDLDKLQANMKNLTTDWKTNALVIGSRAHLEDEAKATRSVFRTFLMHGFHLLVWLFAVRSIRDTQCGFKLLTRAAAKRLFHVMHVERWAFDVELLYLAEQLKMPIAEVAVNWKEIEGSKLTPFWSWLEMGRDLFLIWVRYTFGIWKIENER